MRCWVVFSRTERVRIQGEQDAPSHQELHDSRFVLKEALFIVSIAMLSPCVGGDFTNGDGTGGESPRVFV